MGFRAGLVIGGLAAAVIALAVAVVLLANDGGDSSGSSSVSTSASAEIRSYSGAACRLGFAGGKAEIELNNSDLTCVEARRTFEEYRDLRRSGEAAGIGHTTSVDSNWACQEYALAVYPLMARCEESSKRFDVVGLAPSAHLTPKGAAHPGPLGQPVVFRSPTGNIACSLSTEAVRCDILKTQYEPGPKPSRCEANAVWGHSFLLTQQSAKALCTTDAIVDFTDESGVAILPYGREINRGPYFCFMQKTGLACGTPNEHYLFLSYQRITGI